jgi:hypothetical protein
MAKKIQNGVTRHSADLAVEKFTKTGNAYNRSTDFATKKEADAFRQGIDFVNDFDESEGDSESQVVR